MASQQILIRETILGMTRRLAREKEGLHSSDNESPQASNRHNKLKRRAEFYHEGEMGGRIPYKRKIEHAGYSRYILKYNPRRYDEEGYELESDDEDSDADREAADKNPYGGIRVEETLGPLTHVKDLQHHPAMSRPYKSHALPSMIKDTLDMVHRERKSLVDVKHLLEPLRGDQSWIPAGALEHEDDTMLFGTELQGDGTFAAIDPRPFRVPTTADADAQVDEVHVNGITEPLVNGSEDDERKKHEQSNGLPQKAGEDGPGDMPQPAKAVEAAKDKDMADAKALDPAAEGENTRMGDGSTNGIPKKESDTDDAPAPDVPEVSAADADTSMLDVPKSSNPPTPSAISSPTNSPPRMLTRGRAAATNGTPNPNASSRSPSLGAANVAAAASSRSPSPPPLHPLYLTPRSAGPDKDLGLPPAEAEDLRRMISAYVQKQEEVCRGADRLHRGLLKAQRLRDTVWWWARAEEHRGEMSDGEDWVDMEEWKLDGPLRKGNETGVDETAVDEQATLGIAALGAAKKTRGRRVAG